MFPALQHKALDQQIRPKGARGEHGLGIQETFAVSLTQELSSLEGLGWQGSYTRTEPHVAVRTTGEMVLG